LGAPGTTSIRFAGVAAGKVRLDLVYRRPWEKDRAPMKTFSVYVEVAKPTPYIETPEPKADEPASGIGTSEVDLPSSFNWCDSKACTPVRDQGQCGSCWAFATVGPLESAILIKDTTSRDLSEQYLVSCNSDGWSCNGGWFAHEYHQWKYVYGEGSAGAVWESNFPYQASNVPCNPPHTHHEKIESWAYVDPNVGVPAVNDIKQAIYDHGPVGAAVCVNLAFQLYQSGVFNPLIGCNSINHAIVLVGWNDTDGAWILRNSWGSGWGEEGYMRIAYGKSLVGYAANYVVYNSHGCTNNSDCGSNGGICCNEQCITPACFSASDCASRTCYNGTCSDTQICDPACTYTPKSSCCAGFNQRCRTTDDCCNGLTCNRFKKCR
jgi:C1A family cysteine protease